LQFAVSDVVKAKASSLKVKAWTFEAKAIVPRPRPLSIRLPQKLRYAVRLTG